MAITPQTLDFLFENRLQNSKEWFHAHKTAYEELVLHPLEDLVCALQPVMQQIDPKLIIEPKVTRSISRIYRDTRYSKDKSLYRDNMWLIFKKKKKLYEGLPGFYFDFSQQGFSYGCGYYQASADTMACLREMILRKEPPFQEALRAYERQSVFELDGDCYKRSRYPEYPENIRQWLDRKNIGFNRDSQDFGLLFSDQLAAKLAEDFLLLKPLYEFLLLVESRRERG